MAVLSDYVTILGDAKVQIGDGHNESGWIKNFGTGGRFAGSNTTAFISFMVKGMTQSTDNAEVRVNNTKIGVLYRNKGGNRQHWNTQSVSMMASTLKSSGNNLLTVHPVHFDGDDNNGSNVFDDYFLTNVICHYKQKS